MSNKNGKWADINKAGSGTAAGASDKCLDVDTRQTHDNAENASRLHQQANELADRSGK